MPRIGYYEKPQPNQPVYGLQELEVYDRWTAEEAKAAGILTPFDPTEQVKNWIAGPELFVYGFYDAVTGVRKTLDTSFLRSGALNLWTPKPTYPPYGNPSGDNRLATVQEAIDIQRELADLMPDSKLSMDPSVQARGEYFPFILTSGARKFAVGDAVVHRNRSGIGHPGVWEMDSEDWGVGSLFFRLTPWPAQPTGDPLPVPMRELKPNEVLEKGMHGGWQVRRTDLTPTPGQDGFTVADRTMLQDLHRMFFPAKL